MRISGTGTHFHYNKGGGGWDMGDSISPIYKVALGYMQVFLEYKRLFAKSKILGFYNVKNHFRSMLSVFGVKKAAYGLHKKQNFDCEKRFLEYENSFKSTKAFPEACQIFLVSATGQRIFVMKSEPEFFFLVKSTPHKIKRLLPS